VPPLDWVGWISAQDGAVYTLLPSITSVVVTLGGTRPLSKYLEADVHDLMPNELDMATAVVNVSVAWHLKISAVVAFVLFFPSWFSALRHHMVPRELGALLFLVVGLLWVIIPVLKEPIDQLNTAYTVKPTTNRLIGWLRVKSDAHFYSRLLLIPHFALLVANILSFSSS
jgi:hypothetical protein